MVPLQVLVGVRLRVGFEVDTQIRSLDPGIEVHGQVFDGPGGQDVQMTDDVAELQHRVEHHEIHRRPEQSALPGALADVTTHVFVPVQLPPEGTGQLGLDGADQIGDGGRRGDGQTHRNDVGHHSPGPAELGRVASGDRQTQDHVFAVGHPREVRRKRRDDRGSRTTRRIAGRLVEKRRGVVGKRGRGESRELSRDRALLRQRERGRQIRRSLRPVFAVLGESVRFPVAPFIGDDLGQGRTLGGRDLGTRCEGGVHLGDARHHRHRAEAVERDVMGADVPVVVVGADAQKGADGQPVPEEINRAAVLVAHPALRRGLGIGGIDQVDEFDGVIDAAVHTLQGQTIGFDEA